MTEKEKAYYKEVTRELDNSYKRTSTVKVFNSCREKETKKASVFWSSSNI